MQIQISHDVPSYLSEAAITDVVACRVLWLLTGRNSWNGNWSSRYSEFSSFHTTLDSAQRVAESQRKQGSTFSIFERPAVRILTEVGKIVAIHLNTSRPFADWRVRPPAGGWWRPRYTLDNTTDAGTIMAALNIGSGHWATRPPEDETVLFVAGTTSLSFPFLAGAKLHAWRSNPLGTHRYFGWEPRENRISPKGAYQAAGLMTRRLALGERRTRKAS